MKQLYYTEAELMSNKHKRFVETETNFMFTQDDEKFYYYKKLFLLQKDALELKEIYVDINQYLIIRNYIENVVSRYIKEFEGYVFYSIKDYIDQLNEANKNRMF